MSTKHTHRFQELVLSWKNSLKFIFHYRSKMTGNDAFFTVKKWLEMTDFMSRWKVTGLCDPSTFCSLHWTLWCRGEQECSHHFSASFPHWLSYAVSIGGNKNAPIAFLLLFRTEWATKCPSGGTKMLPSLFCSFSALNNCYVCTLSQDYAIDKSDCHVTRQFELRRQKRLNVILLVCKWDDNLAADVL